MLIAKVAARFLFALALFVAALTLLPDSSAQGCQNCVRTDNGWLACTTNDCLGDTGCWPHDTYCSMDGVFCWVSKGDCDEIQ